ncbi:hypothetical protein BaRGS_00029954, partial [Batillaria attramentaria]
ILWEASRGPGYQSDIAIDDVSTAVGRCPASLPEPPPGLPPTTTAQPPVSTKTLVCDFNSPGICGYEQLTTDDFNWTQKFGQTPSSNTGPSGSAPADKYMYLETSWRDPGSTAELLSPLFTPSTAEFCLHFFYNMYGWGMGSLTVFSLPNGDPNNLVKLWSLSGNQGQGWKRVSLNVDGSTPVKLSCAINCAYILTRHAWPVPSSHVTLGLSHPHTSRLAYPILTRHARPVPSSHVTLGLSHPHTSRLACPLLTRHAWPVPSSHVTLDLSPPHTSRLACPILTRHAWPVPSSHVTLDLSPPHTSRLTCPILTRHAWPVPSSHVTLGLSPPHTSRLTCPLLTPASCDFELPTICGYTQETGDDFDWTRHRGRTASSSTGPTGDHTTGTGYYMYFETSEFTSPLVNAGDRAVLLSPHIKHHGVSCVTFWYNMYGSSMGTLNVYTQEGNNQRTVEFTRSGNQWQGWKKGTFEVDIVGVYKQYWDRMLTVLSHMLAELVFEGIDGSSYRGDMAIDDVLVVPGNCPATEVIHLGVNIITFVFDHNSANYSSANHSSTNHSSANHSSTNHSSTNHSSTNHSSTNHSSTNHSSTNHSSANHSSTNHSSANHSSANHSSTNHPSTNHSSANHSSTNHSSTNHSSANHSSTNHSSTNHSSAHSSTNHSSANHSGANHSGANHSSTNHSSTNHSSANHSSTNHSSTNNSSTRGYNSEAFRSR